MTYRVQINDIVRDATSEEVAQIEADIAAEQARVAAIVPPTKEQLLAQLNALAAQIQACNLILVKFIGMQKKKSTCFHSNTRDFFK